jgi:hypothetical protein
MGKEDKIGFAVVACSLDEIADRRFLEAIRKSNPPAKTAAEGALAIGRVTTVPKS